MHTSIRSYPQTQTCRCTNTHFQGAVAEQLSRECTTSLLLDCDGWGGSFEHTGYTNWGTHFLCWNYLHYCSWWTNWAFFFKPMTFFSLLWKVRTKDVTYGSDGMSRWWHNTSTMPELHGGDWLALRVCVFVLFGIDCLYRGFRSLPLAHRNTRSQAHT